MVFWCANKLLFIKSTLRFCVIKYEKKRNNPQNKVEKGAINFIDLREEHPNRKIFERIDQ